MLPADWLTLVGLLMGVVGTLMTGIWGIAWWLSKQFTAMRGLIFSQIEKMQELILAKLEYHEKHDDSRFQSVTNEIWAIKVRNAAIDGVKEAQRIQNQGKH